MTPRRKKIIIIVLIIVILAVIWFVVSKKTQEAVLGQNGSVGSLFPFAGTTGGDYQVEQNSPERVIYDQNGNPISGNNDLNNKGLINNNPFNNGTISILNSNDLGINDNGGFGNQENCLGSTCLNKNRNLSLKLNGDSNVGVNTGNPYSDAGAIAHDTVDGDITSWIVTSVSKATPYGSGNYSYIGDISTIDTASTSMYMITYSVTSTGPENEPNHKEVTRLVHVCPTCGDSSQSLILKVLGDNPAGVNIGDTYHDAGATVTDTNDPSITTADIVLDVSKATTYGGVDFSQTCTPTNFDGISNCIDTSASSTYLVTYQVTDTVSPIQTAIKYRIINVCNTCGNNGQDPAITIIGDNPMGVNIGDVYTESGATAYDTVDGDITSWIVNYVAKATTYGSTNFVSLTYNGTTTIPLVNISGLITTSASSTYRITYHVKDSRGISDTKYRVVNVCATCGDGQGNGPKITVLGDNPAGANVGTIYLDDGASVEDNIDTSIATSSLHYRVSKAKTYQGADWDTGTTTTFSGIKTLVSTNSTSTYLITYNVIDSFGLTDTKFRTVNVCHGCGDSKKPKITLNGDLTSCSAVGSKYKELGAVVNDPTDNPVPSSKISIEYVKLIPSNNPTNSVSPGLLQKLLGAFWPQSQPTTPPQPITGQNPQTQTLLQKLLGAFWPQSQPTTPPQQPTSTSTPTIVSTSTLYSYVQVPKIDTLDASSTYLAIYSFTDSIGESAIEFRTITAAGNSPCPSEPSKGSPVLTLLGKNPAGANIGDVYNDDGATVVDLGDTTLTDGNITARISKLDTSSGTATTSSYIFVADATTTSGNTTVFPDISKYIDTSATSTYLITYNVKDNQVPQQSSQKTREIDICENCGGSTLNKPVIGVNGGATLCIAPGTVYSELGGEVNSVNDSLSKAKMYPDGSVQGTPPGASSYITYYQQVDSSTITTSPSSTTQIATGKSFLQKIIDFFWTPSTGTSETANISVTAQDGQTKSAYSVHFSVSTTQGSTTNSGSPSTTGTSTATNDATLFNLDVKEGKLSPAFKSSIYSYEVVLPYGTTQTPTITSSPSNPSSLVAPVSTVTMLNHSGTSTIVVTAPNGATTKSYVVHFSIASSQSNDATLSDINLSNGTLSPKFDPTVHSYEVVLPYGTTIVPTVTPKTNNFAANASVTQATSIIATSTSVTNTSATLTNSSGTNSYSYEVTPDIGVVDLGKIFIAKYSYRDTMGLEGIAFRTIAAGGDSICPLPPPAPVTSLQINLNGKNPDGADVGTTYNDPGAVSFYNDGVNATPTDITAYMNPIIISKETINGTSTSYIQVGTSTSPGPISKSILDTSSTSTYKITYSINYPGVASSTNYHETQRTVNVCHTCGGGEYIPVITLNGEATNTVVQGSTYVDPWVSAWDTDKTTGENKIDITDKVVPTYFRLTYIPPPASPTAYPAPGLYATPQSITFSLTPDNIKNVVKGGFVQNNANILFPGLAIGALNLNFFNLAQKVLDASLNTNTTSLQQDSANISSTIDGSQIPSDVKIRYTIDGTTPSCPIKGTESIGHGTIYSNEIPVIANVTSIKAIACGTGGASSVIEYGYNVTYSDFMPTAIPSTGSFDSQASLVVTLNEGTTTNTTNNTTNLFTSTSVGNTMVSYKQNPILSQTGTHFIHYVVNSSINPTCSSNLYTGPITLRSSSSFSLNQEQEITLKAITCVNGYPSPVSSFTYTVTNKAPNITASPAPGDYYGAVSISLSNSDTGSRNTVVSTTNGTTSSTTTSNTVTNTNVQQNNNSFYQAMPLAPSTSIFANIFNFLMPSKAEAVVAYQQRQQNVGTVTNVQAGNTKTGNNTNVVSGTKTVTTIWNDNTNTGVGTYAGGTSSQNTSTIHYTTDGSIPTCYSATYSSPLTVTPPSTTGNNTSNTSSGTNTGVQQNNSSSNLQSLAPSNSIFASIFNFLMPSTAKASVIGAGGAGLSTVGNPTTNPTITPDPGIPSSGPSTNNDVITNSNQTLITNTGTTITTGSGSNITTGSGVGSGAGIGSGADVILVIPNNNTNVTAQTFPTYKTTTIKAVSCTGTTPSNTAVFTYNVYPIDTVVNTNTGGIINTLPNTGVQQNNSSSNLQSLAPSNSIFASIFNFLMPSKAEAVVAYQQRQQNVGGTSVSGTNVVPNLGTTTSGTLGTKTGNNTGVLSGVGVVNNSGNTNSIANTYSTKMNLSTSQTPDPVYLWEQVPNIDTSIPATYLIHYDATDSYGSVAATVGRQVNVCPTTNPTCQNNLPVITLTGDSNIKLFIGDVYIEAGATVMDPNDGDITDRLHIQYQKRLIQTAVQKPTDLILASIMDIISPSIANAITFAGYQNNLLNNTSNSTPIYLYTDVSNISTSVDATYVAIYTAQNKDGKAAVPVIRTISVGKRTKTNALPPEVNLNGTATNTVYSGSDFLDEGVTAVDPKDGDLSDKVKIQYFYKPAPATPEPMHLTYSVDNGTELDSFPPGNVTTSTTIYLTSARADKIYYTTNSRYPTCTPSADSILYDDSKGITVTSTLVKAVGCNNNGSSFTAKLKYTLTPYPDDVIASPPSGTATEDTKITLSSVNSYYILYTTDGGTPSCGTDSAPRKTFMYPIRLGLIADATTSSATIKAVGCNDVGQSPDVMIYGYISTSNPVPDIQPGSYPADSTDGKALHLSSAISDRIHYTTDGSTPTCSSPIYSDHIWIPISNSYTIKAMTCNNNGGYSGVTNLTYNIYPNDPVGNIATGVVETDNSANLTIFSGGATSIHISYIHRDPGTHQLTGTTPDCTGPATSMPIIMHPGSHNIAAIGCAFDPSGSIISSKIVRLSYNVIPTMPIVKERTSQITGHPARHLYSLSTTFTGGNNQIRYTEDGTNPTCINGTIYDSTVPLWAKGAKLMAITCYTDNYTPSNILGVEEAVSSIPSPSFAERMVKFIFGGEVAHAQTAIDLGIPTDNLSASSTPGDYNILYSATNSSGLTGQAIREVNLGALATTTAANNLTNTDGCGDLDLKTQETTLESLKNTYTTLTGNTVDNIPYMHDYKDPTISDPYQELLGLNNGSSLTFLDALSQGKSFDQPLRDISFNDDSGQSFSTGEVVSNHNGTKGGLIANCWEETSKGSDFYGTSKGSDDNKLSQFPIVRIADPNAPPIDGITDSGDESGDNNFLKGWDWQNHGGANNNDYKLLSVDAPLIYTTPITEPAGKWQTWIAGLQDSSTPPMTIMPSWYQHLDGLFNANMPKTSYHTDGDMLDVCITSYEGWGGVGDNKSSAWYNLGSASVEQGTDYWNGQRIPDNYNCYTRLAFKNTGTSPTGPMDIYARYTNEHINAGCFLWDNNTGKFKLDPHEWDQTNHVSGDVVFLTSDVKYQTGHGSDNKCDGSTDSTHYVPAQKWFIPSANKLTLQRWEYAWNENISKEADVTYDATNTRGLITTIMGLW